MFRLFSALQIASRFAVVLGLVQALLTESNIVNRREEWGIQAPVRFPARGEVLVSVIIMAAGRSGSTMLGELFGQNEVKLPSALR